MSNTIYVHYSKADYAAFDSRTAKLIELAIRKISGRQILIRNRPIIKEGKRHWSRFGVVKFSNDTFDGVIVVRLEKGTKEVVGFIKDGYQFICRNHDYLRLYLHSLSVNPLSNPPHTLVFEMHMATPDFDYHSSGVDFTPWERPMLTLISMPTVNTTPLPPRHSGPKLIT